MPALLLDRTQESPNGQKKQYMAQPSKIGHICEQSHHPAFRSTPWELLIHYTQTKKKRLQQPPPRPFYKPHPCTRFTGTGTGTSRSCFPCLCVLSPVPPCNQPSHLSLQHFYWVGYFYPRTAQLRIIPLAAVVPYCVTVEMVSVCST